MQKVSLIIASLCISLATASSVAAQNSLTARKTNKATLNRDIITTVSSTGGFTTLTKAFKTTDLTGALSQAGPFTVFAPTDAAFAAVASLPELLKSGNKEQLASILRFHVVQGKLMASELRDGQTIATLTGEELSVTVINGKVTVNGTEITQPNVMASNGVIHVINQVMLPGAYMGNK